MLLTLPEGELIAAPLHVTESDRLTEHVVTPAVG